MKTIWVQVKQLGKKRPTVAASPITLATHQSSVSLREFLCLLVAQQYAAYLTKPSYDEKDGTPKPPNDYLNVLINTGKAGFGEVHHQTNPDLKTMQENALQCFEDGMYAVFFQETQLHSLDEWVCLDDEPCFSFIRLTFLTGGYF